MSSHLRGCEDSGIDPETEQPFDCLQLAPLALVTASINVSVTASKREDRFASDWCSGVVEVWNDRV
jgi:hypothetical protein